MKQLISKFSKIVKNEAFLFAIGKYFAFVLQFLNGILIAKQLGPFYFGIYGFILLVIRYLRFLNFGVHYSVNVELSSKQDDFSVKKARTGIGLTIVFAGLIGLISFVLHYENYTLFPKYNFSKYLVITSLIGIMIIFNLFLSNVNRVWSRFFSILPFFILPQLFLLISLVFIEHSDPVLVLLIGFLLGHITAFIILIVNYPYSIVPSFKQSIIKLLLKRGSMLLLYNASFYFVMIGARTIVSAYYNVEELGYFTFANNVAQASIQSLGVIGYIFFPKLLNRLREGRDLETIRNLLVKVREIYVITFYFLVFILVILYNFLVLFLSEYEASKTVFIYLILMQLFVGSAFGYTHLIIARGGENKIAKYSFISLIISLSLSLFLVNFIKSTTIIHVAACTSIGMFFYLMAIVRRARTIIKYDINYKTVLAALFPLNLSVPLIFLLVIDIYFEGILITLIPLLLLVVLNLSSLGKVIKNGTKIFENKKYVEI